METANRTVIGDNSTSQEAQEYIHNFPITSSALSDVPKMHIAEQPSIGDMFNLVDLLKDQEGGHVINGNDCAKIALFICDTLFIAAAEDLTINRNPKTFICQQAIQLYKLIMPKTHSLGKEEAKRTYSLQQQDAGGVGGKSGPDEGNREAVKDTGS